MIDHSLVTGFTMFIRRSFDMTCFGISTYHRHEPPLVSRHGRCFVVCASRSLRGAKKHRTAGIWGISVSMRVPARTPLVSTARALSSARRRAYHFRVFTSVVSRLAPGGCLPVVWEKIEVFLA